MLEVVLVGSVPAVGREAPGLERLARPVGQLRAAGHRPPAAVHQAADDAMFGVVVGGQRVVAQVEAGEAPHARLPRGVVRVAQSFLEQRVVALAVVEPVHAGRKLAEVHAVPRQLGGRRARLRVLPDVPVDSRAVAVQQDLRGAQRVQVGQAVDVLRRVVGAVQRSPARHAQQVAARVEVAVVELQVGVRDRVEHLPFEQRPVRRRHRFADVERGSGHRYVPVVCRIAARAASRKEAAGQPAKNSVRNGVAGSAAIRAAGPCWTMRPSSMA